MQTQNPSLKNKPDAGHNHTGHRKKMWQDFKDNPQSLTDTDIIEMALMLVIPRCDVRPVARRLLHEFKSLYAVVHTPVEQLTAVKGLGEKSARIFPLLAQVLQQASCPQQAPHILLKNAEEITAYCQGQQKQTQECFRLLILNTHHRLVHDEVLLTTPQQPITPLILTQKTIQYGAAAVIIVHHFPNKNPAPKKDIEAAQVIDSILTDLSIHLSEYVITTPQKIQLLKEKHLF